MGNYDDLYRAAFAAWGEEAQIMQAAEECTELALACHHYCRAPVPANREDIIEEIADAELMIGQLRHMLGITDDEIEGWKQRKVARVMALLT